MTANAPAWDALVQAEPSSVWMENPYRTIRAQHDQIVTLTAHVAQLERLCSEAVADRVGDGR